MLREPRFYVVASGRFPAETYDEDANGPDAPSQLQDIPLPRGVVEGLLESLDIDVPDDFADRWEAAALAALESHQGFVRQAANCRINGEGPFQWECRRRRREQHAVEPAHGAAGAGAEAAGLTRAEAQRRAQLLWTAVGKLGRPARRMALPAGLHGADVGQGSVADAAEDVFDALEASMDPPYRYVSSSAAGANRRRLLFERVAGGGTRDDDAKELDTDTEHDDDGTDGGTDDEPEMRDAEDAGSVVDLDPVNLEEVAGGGRDDGDAGTRRTTITALEGLARDVDLATVLFEDPRAELPAMLE